MISLDCKEYLIPLVPMEIPSETPMELNCMAFKPALLMDSEHLLFKSNKCMLHGLPDHQTEPTPIWPLLKSSFLKPVA
ncbi:hypothetical protein WICPIJ_005505 [Wickerhamomyces pijperi]|uniref:Uncharacterized protein n=1 Tax=Wickerhamomyces pijperi TaxID=599730 RepID=A0A9P8TLV4_WICPI|nr:hypothetical protein WICPIJ_005505 [Wickerhamomyces pijperi]